MEPLLPDQHRLACHVLRIMDSPIFFLVIALAGTVVGYLIGNSKGRGVLGAVLGFSLGSSGGSSSR